MLFVCTGVSGISMELVIQSFCKATAAYFCERIETKASLIDVRLILVGNATLNEARKYCAYLADNVLFFRKLEVSIDNSNPTGTSSASHINAGSSESNRSSNKCGHCFKDVSGLKEVSGVIEMKDCYLNIVCGHLLCQACNIKRKQDSCHMCKRVHKTWINKQPPGSMKITEISDFNKPGKIEIQEVIPPGEFWVNYCVCVYTYVLECICTLVNIYAL